MNSTSVKSVEFNKSVQTFKSGVHQRPDGRTEVIFENGTESNMMYQSLYKALQSNGKSILQNKKNVNEQFLESFSDITEEDKSSGYIYVLKSLSDDPEIALIQNLYKIGYSKNPVPQRIKDAHNEPTYLMAPVELLSAYKCFFFLWHLTNILNISLTITFVIGVSVRNIQAFQVLQNVFIKVCS